MADEQHYLTVNIVTPDGLIYSHRAKMIVVNAMSGQLGIMANHEPIVTPLRIGEVHVDRVEDAEPSNDIAVNGGFMEVSDNVATIVADTAERARNIDLTRAEAARSRAQQRIEAAKAQHDKDELQRAQVALARAVNRIQVRHTLGR